MTDIKKITFLDIETAGEGDTFDSISTRKSQLWKHWQDKATKGHVNVNVDYDKGQIAVEVDYNESWVDRAGLHAEFGRVVCVSFGYYDAAGAKRIMSFNGENEKDILEKTAKVLNNSDANKMIIGGHHVERFDVPYLWKRMLANGIKPPNIISVLDKKPWDIKMFDTAKAWGGGSFKESMVSLDVLSAVFGLPSPKQDLKGNKVHEAFWNGEHDRIREYCEMDVSTTMDIAERIIELTK